MASELPKPAKLVGAVVLAVVNVYAAFQSMMFEAAKRIVLALLVTPLYLSSSTKVYAQMAWASVGITLVGGTVGALKLSWDIVTGKRAQNLYALDTATNNPIANLMKHKA